MVDLPQGLGGNRVTTSDLRSGAAKPYPISPTTSRVVKKYAAPVPTYNGQVNTPPVNKPAADILPVSRESGPEIASAPLPPPAPRQPEQPSENPTDFTLAGQNRVQKTYSPTNEASRTERVLKTTETAAKTTGAVAQAGGTGMQVAGKGMQVAGKGIDMAGSAMMRGGAALSSTGVGAIAGVPLAIVGGATKVLGTGTKVAGKATETAGRVTKKAGKGMRKAGNQIGKARGMAKTKSDSAISPARLSLRRKIESDPTGRLQQRYLNRVSNAIPNPAARMAFKLAVNNVAQVKAVSISVEVFSWATPLWFTLQLPLAIVCAVFFAFIEVGGDLLEIVYDPTDVFVALYFVVFALGLVTYIGAAFQYIFAGVSCFFGRGALFKFGSFVIGFFFYMMPILNMFPWFMLWAFFVNKYPN